MSLVIVGCDYGKDMHVEEFPPVSDSKEDKAGAKGTHWESLYSGQARDYQAPDSDIIEALADLKPAEALDVGCGAGGLCLELCKRG